MKKLLLLSFIFLFLDAANGQVTQINANKSLYSPGILNNTRAIFVSSIDSSVWVSDGTLAGTIQLSDTIKFGFGSEVLNNNLIFAGSSPNCGSEIFITDGTRNGTKIIKDIFPGSTGSNPDYQMAILNGFVYFTDSTAAEGRELWRTDGTAQNTTLVKDIIPGAASSNLPNSYELFSNGSFLLLDVKDPVNGNELWISGGTAATTNLLKDINPGTASSDPQKFYAFNNIVLFSATDAAHGDEIWRTDGTAAGTILLKDINPGPDSSTYISTQIAPGVKINLPVFLSFHEFNNHLFFMANDGVHGSAIWVTDGTTANTNFLKATMTDTSVNNFGLLDAVNLPGKFIFPVSNETNQFELWQSDGTAAGTVLFKSFAPNPTGTTSSPIIYVNFSFNPTTHQLSYPLLNGKFFFSASGPEGNELWMSDGTVAGTQIVKDINPGAANGIVSDSYLYTTSGMFFAANDGVHGNELWKTDGTAAGTVLVQDIFPGTHNANPVLEFVSNNKVFFTATDGNPDSLLTDLYVVNGNFTALPVQLLDFTVSPKGNDGFLQWSTSQEINTKDFLVESSDDAQHWNALGNVPAAGNSSVKINYSFTDAGVMNCGKNIVYYRLAARDIDGKISNSNIIYLKIGNAGQWNVQLYSNPVRGYVNLMLSGVSGIAQLSIHDLSGKIIYKKQIENQNGQLTLPVSLQAGVYILSVKANNERKSIQFIKE